MRNFLLAVVFVSFSFGGGALRAENLNYMSSGQEEWSIERMQKEISALEGEIKLSQMRLESMKKELANKLSTVNTAAGDSQESERDHFMSHY